MRFLRRLREREPLLPRGVRIALAAGLGAAAITLAALSSSAAQEPSAQPTEDEVAQGLEPLSSDGEIAAGRALFLQGCSDCHGADARGIEGVAPTLHGVGEESADFYLRTGRMPLDDPEDEPVRTESPYTQREIDELVAYVGSLGGPPIPEIDPQAGEVGAGYELFRDRCAGCHQIVAQGGITTRGLVPDLQVAEPVDVAEAVAVGPFVMPKFPDLRPQDVEDLAAYVEYTKDPVDRGGWGIGHIGPIPEGMVAWLLAGAALLFAIRLIGERTTR